MYDLKEQSIDFIGILRVDFFDNMYNALEDLKRSVLREVLNSEPSIEHFEMCQLVKSDQLSMILLFCEVQLGSINIETSINPQIPYVIESVLKFAPIGT